jgi:hypothetical protein
MELPEGRKALPSHWVYKIKRDGAGNVQQFKGRVQYNTLYTNSKSPIRVAVPGSSSSLAHLLSVSVFYSMPL